MAMNLIYTNNVQGTALEVYVDNVTHEIQVKLGSQLHQFKQPNQADKMELSRFMNGVFLAIVQC
jgi:hypothetical protein